MTFATGLRCLACDTSYPLDAFAMSCSRCRESASGLAVVYDPDMLEPRPYEPRGRGLWRYGDLMPIDEGFAVPLGEGATPLLALPRLADQIGLERIWAKDETRNPTGSFKDRLACIGVGAARYFRRGVVVSSSSGNAGASAAAYAARAGLPCIVFTFRGASETLVTQMRSLGAHVAYTEHKEDRLRLVAEGVRRFGWFPTSPFSDPVTGSNPIALEGYKTLAYEIADDLAFDVPDWVVLPVCYGDALAAVRRGFEDMLALGWTMRVPRLVAAEVSGSLATALATGARQPPAMGLNHTTVATSIGANRGTVQALDALRRSHGVAVATSDESILEWQARLGRTEGIWVEPASAAALAALSDLVRADTIKTKDRVVFLATATGLKDPSPATRLMPNVPVVGSDLDRALDGIVEAYGTPRSVFA